MTVPFSGLENDDDVPLAKEEDIVAEEELETSSESGDEADQNEDMDYWLTSEDEEDETTGLGVANEQLEPVDAEGSNANTSGLLSTADVPVKTLMCTLALTIASVYLSAAYMDGEKFQAAVHKRSLFGDLLYDVAISLLVGVASNHILATVTVGVSTLPTSLSALRCWEDLQLFFGHLTYLYCVALFLFVYFDVQPVHTNKPHSEPRDCHGQPPLVVWKCGASFVSVLVIYALAHIITKLNTFVSGTAPHHPQGNPQGNVVLFPQQEDPAPNIAAHTRRLHCARG